MSREILWLSFLVVACNGRGGGTLPSTGTPAGTTPGGTPSTGTPGGTTGGTPTGTATGSGTDADGDGYTVAQGDCDDADAAVNPGAVEVCGNGIDDNCSGEQGTCGWSGAAQLDGTVVRGHTNGVWAGRNTTVCDTNGDGQDDLVVGGAGASQGANESGATYIFFGPITADRQTDSDDWTIAGDAIQQWAGWDVACGDADGDGLDDVFLSASNTSSGLTGTVYLFAGGGSGDSSVSAPTANWVAEGPNGNLGNSVAAVDDDGDGLVSFAASDWGDSGANAYGSAYLFDATTGAAVADAAGARIYGMYEARMLQGVGSGGDVDGDGDEELLVRGENLPTSAGAAVYLFRGPVSGAMFLDAHDVRIHDDQSSDGLGWDGFAMGHADLNGDGYDDVILGDPSDDANQGSLFIWHGDLSGDTSALLSDAEISGEPDDGFGSSFTSPGDLDGDGNAELLVGSKNSDRWATDGGGVVLFYGPFAGTVATDSWVARWDSTIGTGGAGIDLDIGDLDGDGVPDFAVSAPWAESDIGRVTLFSAWNL